MSIPNEKYREVKLSSSSILTDEIINQLEHLFDAAAPTEFRDTLIEVYHIYILREHQMLPLNFDDMARHLYLLIDFLKLVEKERAQAHHAS